MTPFLKEIISNKYNRVSEGFNIFERGILRMFYFCKWIVEKQDAW